jgi:hypothetical protein
MNVDVDLLVRWVGRYIHTDRHPFCSYRISLSILASSIPHPPPDPSANANLNPVFPFLSFPFHYSNLR